MRVHYINLIDSATLTSDNENPSYPLTALQHIHLANPFRFNSLAASYIDIDLGSAQDVSSIGIISNLTADATIVLKGNSSESWAAPPVEETVTAADRNLMHYFTEATYRYWRLEITDAANGDGYVEINRLYLGGYLQMPAFAGGLQVTHEDLSSRRFSPAGQPFSVERGSRRSIAFNMPYVLASEKASYDTVLETVGIHTPMWVAVWESDFTKLEPLYVLHAEGKVNWRKISKGDWLWEADLEYIESK